MTRHRRLCAFLLSLVVALAPATPALAQGDNTAVAVNTKDGASVFKLAFSIKKTLQPVVENGNAAVAYSSCENCQTVAIAIQVVLVMGDVDVVNPENVAIAINQECTSCETLASAYQYVLGTGGVVRLTKEGRKQVNAIRKALKALGRSGLSITEIQARVDELFAQLKKVFGTELELVGPDDIRGEEADDGDDAEGSADGGSAPSGGAAPQGGETPEATSSPATSPDPNAPPEATATPTASPQPTASPEPSTTATPTATTSGTAATPAAEPTP